MSTRRAELLILALSKIYIDMGYLRNDVLLFIVLVFDIQIVPIVIGNLNLC